ncbi:hypothetical protein [Nocardioides sp. WS12]|uniref:hypothetical protein n=1 Tax=Nocardioides sp. WS12 TaxID=2486272 RepID=UPI0015F85FF9|nr:hypothetical protein [Nocardioides sp. WS12]
MSRHAVLRSALVTTTTLALSIGALSVSAQADPVSPAPGVVHAWGYNQFGETQPPASLDGKNVVAVSGGFLNTLALTDDGKVTAWGYNEGGKSQVPASLDNEEVVALAAGIRTSYAVTAEGTIVAWGEMFPGDSEIPPSLTGKHVTAIAADRNAMALTDDGHVTTWDYAGDELAVPLDIAQATFASIDTSEGAFFGVTTDGEARAWGIDDADQTEVPASLAGVVVTEVAGSETSAFALTGDGHVVAWGDHPMWMWRPPTGQTTIPAALADEVVVDIAAGSRHSMALTADGQLFVWGETYWVGAIPEGLVGITALAGGTSHAIVSATGVEQVVVPGTITLPSPVVTGTPVVDQPLTVSLAEAPALNPADAEITHVWQRDDTTEVGTGTTYTPTAADVGHTLHVTTTATRDGFDDATAGVDTAEVELAEFSTMPVPTISGTLKVGETLTANAGSIAPTPGQVDFQWYADGDAIDDATSAEYLVGSGLTGAVLTVGVTATRPGYVDGSALSAASAPVATNRAPGITLDTGRTQLRRGQSTTLGWVVTDASAAEASGSWSGTKPASGSQTVRPLTLGSHTYLLSATNANGTTTTQVSIRVVRQAKALTVTKPTGIRLAGSRAAFSGRGLDGGETYAIRIDGKTLATGRASSNGTVARTITLPAGTTQGRHSLRLVGSEPDRTGAARVWVVTKDGLKVRLAHREVRASDQQSVTVTGLAPGERIRVSFDGKTVTPRSAHATASGSYRFTFKVGTAWGDKVVKVVGAFSTRSSAARFEVVRRCASGPACD